MSFIWGRGLSVWYIGLKCLTRYNEAFKLWLLNTIITSVNAWYYNKNGLELRQNWTTYATLLQVKSLHIKCITQQKNIILLYQLFKERSVRGEIMSINVALSESRMLPTWQNALTMSSPALSVGTFLLIININYFIKSPLKLNSLQKVSSLHTKRKKLKKKRFYYVQMF